MYRIYQVKNTTVMGIKNYHNYFKEKRNGDELETLAKHTSIKRFGENIIISIIIILIYNALFMQTQYLHRHCILSLHKSIGLLSN